MTEELLSHLISWGNVLTIVVIGGLLTLYILKWGVKYVVVFSLALYLGLFLQQSLDWTVPSLFGVASQLIELLLLTGGVMLLLIRSPISKSLQCAKKPYSLSIVFGYAVFGFTLAHILPYIIFTDTRLAFFVEQAFFGQEIVVLLWTIAPLVLYPFLQSSKRK